MDIEWNKIGGSVLPKTKKQKLKERVELLENSIARIYTYAKNIENNDSKIFEIINEEYLKARK